MDTVVGATDDWRLRHNFFWYVKRNTDKDTNVTTKQLVMLPWDFDRINDAKAETRLSGTPWFDPISRYSKEGQSCTAPLVVPSQMAMESIGGDMSKFEHFKAIWELLPADMSRVIQCDQMTKLMAVALKEAIQARTIQMMETDVSLTKIKAKMAKFGALITNAQLASGDKPSSVSEWNNKIQALYDYQAKSQKYAVDQAAASGITKENYKNYLWGGVPEENYYDYSDDEEDYIVSKPGAAGQSISDTPTYSSTSPFGSFGSTQFGSFGNNANTVQSTQWGQPAPRTQFGNVMNGFSSNLGGSFGGSVAFRG